MKLTDKQISEMTRGDLISQIRLLECRIAVPADTLITVERRLTAPNKAELNGWLQINHKFAKTNGIEIRRTDDRTVELSGMKAVVDYITRVTES